MVRTKLYRKSQVSSWYWRQAWLLLQVRGLTGRHNLPTFSRLGGGVRLQLLGGIHGHFPRVAQRDERGGDSNAWK